PAAAAWSRPPCPLRSTAEYGLLRCGSWNRDRGALLPLSGAPRRGWTRGAIESARAEPGRRVRPCRAMPTGRRDPALSDARTPDTARTAPETAEHRRDRRPSPD